MNDPNVLMDSSERIVSCFFTGSVVNYTVVINTWLGSFNISINYMYMQTDMFCVTWSHCIFQEAQIRFAPRITMSWMHQLIWCWYCRWCWKSTAHWALFDFIFTLRYKGGVILVLFFEIVLHAYTWSFPLDALLLI